MPAYLIVDCEVTDFERYEVYKQLAPPAIAKYGGRYLVRGGATTILEGNWRPVEVAAGASPAPQPGFWPGLYERAEDRTVRAVNAEEVRLPRPPADDWKQRLDRLLSRHDLGTARPLSPHILVAAAGCLALAAAAWKRSPDRNLTAFSAPRTVPGDRESSYHAPRNVTMIDGHSTDRPSETR